MQRDAHGFDAALQRLVHTAHGLRRDGRLDAPGGARRLARTRAQGAAGGSGPGTVQRLLLRVAVEWAALAEAAETDRLFAHRPAAWIASTLAWHDALTQHLLAPRRGPIVPTLMLSADPAPTTRSMRGPSVAR